MKLSQKTIEAGDLVSVVEYSRPLPTDTKKQRTAKHQVTTEAQKKINSTFASHKLAFLLAANFRPRIDFFVTLTYEGQAPTRRNDARKIFAAFIRKLRTQRRARGTILKYAYCIESLHGDGRYHHHMVINSTDSKQDFEDIKTLWESGYAKITFLFDEDHKEDTWFSVAKYLVKERPETGKDETPVGSRIFSCSRNLYRPKPKYRIIDEKERAVMPPDATPIEDGPGNGSHVVIVNGIQITLRWLTYQRRSHYWQC